MDEETLLQELENIDLELMEFYDTWDECRSGRYMGEEDSLWIVNTIRKLERRKIRIVSENPVLLQRILNN